jgi:hypothetical protein
MKFSSFVLMLSVCAAFILSACRKGPEDPLLSFRSRKVRLSGEWKVINNNTNILYSNVISSGATETREFNLGSTEFSITGTENFNKKFPVDTTFSHPITGTVDAHAFSFDKEGNFTYNYTYSYEQIHPVRVNGTTQTQKYTVKETVLKNGKWYFAGKSGDFKNKENLVLSVLSAKTSTETSTTIGTASTETKIFETDRSYAFNESLEVWHLIKLRNKEIKMEMKLDGLSSDKTSTIIGSNSPVIVEPGISTAKGSVFFQLKQ